MAGQYCSQCLRLRLRSPNVFNSRLTPPKARLSTSTRQRLSYRRPESRARLRPNSEPIDLNNPRNPLDIIGLRRAADKQRKQAVRDVKRAAFGILFGMGGLGTVIWMAQKEIEAKKEAEGSDFKSERGGLPERVGLVTTDEADSQANGVEAAERFRGKTVEVKTRGDRLVATDAQTGMEVGEMIETGSTTIPHFPKTIMLPSETSMSAAQLQQQGPDEEYTMLGLGVRAVSFLSIKVYVVGIYVRTDDLQRLQSAIIKRFNPTASALIPSEKARLQEDLLDPERSHDLWDALLHPLPPSNRPPSMSDTAATAPGIKTALRITPIRNTDFAHLRDGFLQRINAKTSASSSKKPGDTAEDSFDDDAFYSAVDQLKNLFKSRTKAPKGSALILARDGSAEGQGALTLLFQEQGVDGEQVQQADKGATELQGKEKVLRLGKVEDERVGRLIWLGYLAGKNVASEPARTSVAEGVVKLVERPAGTVQDARVL